MSTMNTVLDQSMLEVRAAIRAFPWSDRAAYGDWLTQTYHYVKHSTRLLAAAAARFPTDEAGDLLHHRFAKHMAEEKKHELLCLHDLKALDFPLGAFSELPTTRMFYASQYFEVEHEDPTALFGYILVLEVTSVREGGWVRARVGEAHGEKAAAFVTLHAEEDVAHVEKAVRALDAVTEAQKERVHRTMRQTARGYRAILEDTARRSATATPSTRP
jgi:thiaminase